MTTTTVDANDVQQINGFPSDFIDPKVKEKKEYALSVAKAIDALENSGQGAITNFMRARWRKNLRYAEGNQETLQYASDMGYKINQEQGSGLAGYADISLDPLGFMNKVIRVVEGTLIGSGHNFVLTAIDPTSQKEKKEYENMLITKQRLGKYAKERFNVDIIGDMYVPDDDETRLVYMKMGFKNAYEAAGEQFLKIVYNDNDYDFVCKPVNVRNLMACGFAAEKTYFDNNGKVKKRACDVTRMGMSYSTRRNFDNIKYVFEEVDYTIAELKTLVWTKDFTEEDWKKIATQYVGKLGNPRKLPYYRGDSCLCDDGSYTYDRFTVTVREIEFSTVDRFVRSRKKDKYDETKSVYKERNFGYKPDKTGTAQRKDVDVRRNYCLSWIVGSDYVFNYGPKTNQSRKKDVKDTPYLDYSMVKVSVADMHYSRPFAHKMKPIENMLQNGWNKLQNAIAHAKIDLTIYQGKALMNAINMGIKGVESIDQLLDAGNGTGNMIVNSTDDFDNPNAGQPVQHIQRGIGVALQEYIALIQFLNQLVREITGVPVIADASAPHPDFGKKVAEMTMASSSRALRELIDANEYLLSHGAEVTLKKIQRLLEDDPDVYENALGSASRDILLFAKGLSAREMGVKVENRMTEEDIQRLYQELKEIVVTKTQAGENSFNVYHYLTLRLDEMIREQPKFAKYWLGLELEKIERKKQQEKKADIEANIQGQQMSNQQTAENKMNELMAKYNLELRNSMQEIVTKISEQLKADVQLARVEAALEPKPANTAV